MFADRLEALLREATPGPWKMIRMLVYAHIKNADGHYVAEPVGKRMQFRHVADAELIAFLASNAPALLEVVKAARDVCGSPNFIGDDIARLRQALTRLSERRGE